MIAPINIMGKAVGVLEYFSRQYVGNNLKLYTPDEELKKMIDPADFPAAGRPGNQKIISRQP